MGNRSADHVTPLFPQKLALTSPTGGGRSVGIVRSRTKATEFNICINTLHKGEDDDTNNRSKNGLQQGDVLSPLLFNFALDYTIRRVQVHQDGLKLNGTHRLLVYADYVNPYPTAFPYGNGMVLHFYQQQESSTTKTVHKVINKGLKTYV